MLDKSSDVSLLSVVGITISEILGLGVTGSGVVDDKTIVGVLFDDSPKLAILVGPTSEVMGKEASVPELGTDADLLGEVVDIEAIVGKWFADCPRSELLMNSELVAIGIFGEALLDDNRLLLAAVSSTSDIVDDGETIKTLIDGCPELATFVTKTGEVVDDKATIEPLFCDIPELELVIDTNLGEVDIDAVI